MLGIRHSQMRTRPAEGALASMLPLYGSTRVPWLEWFGAQGHSTDSRTDVQHRWCSRVVVIHFIVLVLITNQYQYKMCCCCSVGRTDRRARDPMCAVTSAAVPPSLCTIRTARVARTLSYCSIALGIQFYCWLAPTRKDHQNTFFSLRRNYS